MKITIDEPSDADPTATTDLQDAVITVEPEFAHVTGIITPATSPAPLLPPGVRYAALTEPSADPFGPRISDIIRLTVSEVSTRDQLGLFQQLTVDFWSDGHPDFDSILPAGLTPPGVEENGELQDITGLLGIQFPEQNVQVFVRSDIATPEPVAEHAGFALLPIALGAIGLYERLLRKQAST